jgi:hypothetical protein
LIIRRQNCACSTMRSAANLTHEASQLEARRKE